MQDIWSLLAATFRDWYEDRAQRLGAALAYYTIFALTPGLVLVIALAGFLLGQDAEGQILGQIRELIGEQGAAAIEATTRSARTETLGGDRVALFPLVFGLWGLFGELQDGLNTIWGVMPKTGRRVTEIVSSLSASIWGRAQWPRRTEPPAPSSSSWSGSTTRRRSCCLAPSSPRCGRSRRGSGFVLDKTARPMT